MTTQTASAARARAAPVKKTTFDRELEERLLRYVRIDTQS